MKPLLPYVLLVSLFVTMGLQPAPPSSLNLDENPAFESELSSFMKAMFDHTQKVKDKVKKGKKPNFDFDYARVLTAKATFPEKVASPDYKKFAMEYLIAVDALNKAQPAEQLKMYRSVINSCLNCHKVICPGPVPRIKQLELQ